MFEDKFDIRIEKIKLKETKEYNINDKKILEHLNYLEKDDEDFFKKFDVNELIKETNEKINSSNKIIPFKIKTLSTLVAAAACFIIAINIFPSLDRGNKEIILLKGVQQLNIYKKDRDIINKLNNLDRVSANNKIQITYKSNDSYGIIFSIDGLNNITFHYPEDQFNSTKLDVGKEVTLPTSYTLDNAPYFEKFYLITSNNSFDFNLVRDATLLINVSNGRITEDLKLPKKYNINTITLLKE